MLRYVVLLSLQVLISGNAVASQEGPAPASGVAQTRYAIIEVGAQQRAIKVLLGHNSPTKLNLVDQITAQPHKYSPGVLYVLSDILFRSGQRGKGMYWYYVARLRAQYDVNRCRDKSVQATIRNMNEIYGRQIQEYARENPATFKQMIAAAIQFEYDTPHAYDHRWINLHGMHAAQTLLAAQQGMSLNDPRPMSYPQEEWPVIRRQTVQEYSAQMNQLAHSWESRGPYE